MKISYHQPALSTVTANRTIYEGFKFAFEDSGHIFSTYTAGVDLEKFLQENNPDIFITASHFFHRKQLDFDTLKKYRDKGMKVFVKIDFWNSPLLAGRVNEAKSMKDDAEILDLIKKNMFGDIYFHVVEQGDKRMGGFEEVTGHNFKTLPLAADKRLMQNIKFEEKFAADISFIGTNLPQKREVFKTWLFPLAKMYNLKLYGQDWTTFDKGLGWVQKVGQYFNIPIIKSIRKPKLKLEDEATIYKSSKVCVNLHEDYQKESGGDCNERAFKIPAYGGFQISDDVACLRKYFKDGEEIIIAKDKNDWYEKVEYYINNPEERAKIARAGYDRVLRDHTYHNRVSEIIKWYEEIKK